MGTRDCADAQTGRPGFLLTEAPVLVLPPLPRTSISVSPVVLRDGRVRASLCTI